MKRIIQALVLIVVAVSASANIFAQKAKMPTMNGDKAVKKLKENNTYNSLLSAIKSAQTKDRSSIVKTPPEWTTSQLESTTSSDNHPFSYFGYSVAISGNTAVIGAKGQNTGSTADGAVYVFVQSGDIWIQQAKLIASDAGAGDNLGFSVAIDGDTIIAGAPGADVFGGIPRGFGNGISNTGAAYIFVRVDTTWTQQEKLTPIDSEQDAQFGYSVAIDADTVVVGAKDKDYFSDFKGKNSIANGFPINQGAAYVFNRSDASWSFDSKLMASDVWANQNDAQFGSSVAISGETIVIGAIKASNQAVIGQEGAVYVFNYSSSNWLEEARLSDSTLGASAFGSSVAVDGNTLVVGAPYVDDVSMTARGSAFVYVRASKGWSLQEELTPFIPDANFEFGSSVSISQDRIIVGSRGANSQDQPSKGAAYIFNRQGNSWTTKTELLSTTQSAGENFGYSVAVDGNKFITGTPFTDMFQCRTNCAGKQSGGVNGGVIYFYSQLAPTSASVNVGGRVLNSDGRAVANAQVSLTNLDGETRTVITNGFGYYNFEQVSAGETYIFNVFSKKYTFTPQVYSVIDDLTDFDFNADLN
jgi:hypothetical protein